MPVDEFDSLRNRLVSAAAISSKINQFVDSRTQNDP